MGSYDFLKKKNTLQLKIFNGIQLISYIKTAIVHGVIKHL